MGWCGPWAGGVEHEGWAVPVFIDGAEGAGCSGAQGVMVTGPGDVECWRQDADVVGWKAGCECGWRGPLWTRAATAPTDAGLRRVHVPLEGYADLEEADEALVMAAWREHIAPWTRLEALAEAVAEHARTRSELDTAVRAARTAGASWAEIGRATGMTRQSANERWAS